MKYKKDKEKRKKEEKKRQLSQHWGILEWVTNFIQENQDNWEKEIKEKERQATKELDEWNKYKRLEKIELIRKKKNWQQQKEKEPVRPDPPKTPPPPENGKVWRRKVQVETSEIPPELKLGFDTDKENPEDMVSEQVHYEAKKILKQSKIKWTPTPNPPPLKKRKLGVAPFRPLEN